MRGCWWYFLWRSVSVDDCSNMRSPSGFATGCFWGESVDVGYGRCQGRRQGISLEVQWIPLPQEVYNQFFLLIFMPHGCNHFRVLLGQFVLILMFSFRTFSLPLSALPRVEFPSSFCVVLRSSFVALILSPVFL